MATAINNVRIIDGNGFVRERGSICFDESGILEISEEANFRTDRADRIIDGTGKTILPGLIDCHVHLGVGVLGKSVLEEEQAVGMVNQFRDLFSHGITTVRNMGTADDCDIKIRNLVNSGYLEGPRILASGRGFSITGGHGWSMNYEVDTPEETRKAARKAIFHGADVLKMFATGGMGTKGSIPNAPQLSQEQMQVICQEADRAGLLTAAHCTGIEGAERAIRAGVRCIEHIQMDEEVAELMQAHGCFYCPTIVTRYNIIHSTAPEYEHMRKKASPQDLERKRKAIQFCLQYGIPICAGTDSIGTILNDGLTKMGESLLTELMIYQEYGMDNMQVIQSATKTAAQMLRIDEETGTLETGKCADLILVDGNPAENLKDLQNLIFTVKGGRFVYQRAS